METFRTIPLDQIDEPREVLRAHIAPEKVVELGESIRAIGLLQPIGVSVDGERFRVVFGHRRYLALKWLGRVTVEARVLDEATAKELESATAENVVRHDLSPVEEARVIRRMIDGQGLGVREVGSALGKSESWVRQRLEILLWPEEVVAAVARGELVPAVARELVRVEEVQWRAQYLRYALDSGCTASQMRQWVTDWEMERLRNPSDPTGLPAVPPEPVNAQPQVSCAVCDVLGSIASVQYLRVCSPCVMELARSKAAARSGTEG